VGKIRRRGRVPDGLPDRSPDVARNATVTPIQAGDVRRPLKSFRPPVSVTSQRGT